MRMVSIVLSAAMPVFMAGCTSLNTEPVQQTVREVFVSVVQPAVADALKETMTNSFASGGNVQGIAPAYVVEADGFWVVGVKVRARVGVEGVAGGVQWNSQAAQP